MKYELHRVNTNDVNVQDGVDGRCDSYLKNIYVVNCLERYGNPDIEKPFKYYYLHELEILKHEIIHAFLNESGLKHETHSSCTWSQNEEMIDWFAIMFDRIHLTFIEAENFLKQFYGELNVDK